MTEQDFLALSPRERDAAVAEARGWRRVKPQYKEYEHAIENPETGDVTEWIAYPGGGFGACGNMWPSFTEDIATAWELVEEMQADGLSITVAAYHGGDVWASVANNVDNDTADAYVGGAPLAISIAYMKAKGAIT
jgi:hypothetical protein